MAKDKLYDTFVEAYNNFDSRPLRGETMRKFYVDDFAKEYTELIKTTVQITERFRKILIIGHRGCGKSTILNKVAEELEQEYHIVSFSAFDVINMMDVETVDIMLAIYMQLLQSMKEEGIRRFISPFEKMMAFAKEQLRLQEVGLDLLKTISFKIRVENESRTAIRSKLRTEIGTLQRNLSDACRDIYQQSKKDVLIVIDDLDKLDTTFAEQVFIKDVELLTLPEAKIVFTFPLETYYSETLIPVIPLYDLQFIPLVNLYNLAGKYQNESLAKLKKLVLKRIDAKHISEAALKHLIDMSGGLLRDLIKFMQDACKLAIVKNLTISMRR